MQLTALKRLRRASRDVQPQRDIKLSLSLPMRYAHMMKRLTIGVDLLGVSLEIGNYCTLSLIFEQAYL